jgi:hypothetical protein
LGCGAVGGWEGEGGKWNMECKKWITNKIKFKKRTGGGGSEERQTHPSSGACRAPSTTRNPECHLPDLHKVTGRADTAPPHSGAPQCPQSLPVV